MTILQVIGGVLAVLMIGAVIVALIVFLESEGEK